MLKERPGNLLEKEKLDVPFDRKDMDTELEAQLFLHQTQYATYWDMLHEADRTLPVYNRLESDDVFV